MKKALALIAISFGLWSHAQTSRFPPINLYGGDPTGNVCVGNLIQQSSTTGLIYTCQGGHMKTGGGIGNPAGPAFAVNFANSGVNAFQGDSSITINPTTHTFTAPLFALTGCPAGQFIKGDGTGCAAAAAGNPAGSNTQLQFNSGGIFGATTWTWDGAFINSASDTPTGHQLASANAAVTTYSVLAFGAKPDYQISAQGVCSVANTSATLTCPSGTFTTADVGKTVQINPVSGACPVAGTAQLSGITLCTTTISTFTDSAHVVMAQVSTRSISPNFIKWGTDSTSAINQCIAAATTGTQIAGTCTFPSGSYFLASAPYWMYTGASDNGDYNAGGVAIAGGAGGSGAIVTATVAGGQITSYTISNGGSGYTPSSSLPLTFTGGCGVISWQDGPCGWALAYAVTNSSGVVTSINAVSGGYGIVTAPTVTVNPIGGDGAAATVTVAAGSINSTVINAGGAGYLPSSSTLSVWGIGGTGCATVPSHAWYTTTNLTAQGVANTDAGGHVTSITWSNLGSGCTGAPTVIFGQFTCGGVQCTNVAPLQPTKIPALVMLTNSGVNLVGAGGVNLEGVWDGTTVDNNQATMFGGQYITGAGVRNGLITGLFIDQTFIGFHTLWYMATENLTNVNFGVNVGIGGLTRSLDFRGTLTNMEFFSKAAWVNGGWWGTRQDGANNLGGWNNSSAMDNWVFRMSNHSTLTDAIDLWFNNVFWHCEYSQNSTDFLETPACPVATNQRMTDRWINQAQNGNSLVYRGITGWGLADLHRYQTGSQYHSVTNMLGKSLFRGLIYGEVPGNLLNFQCCEGSTQLGADVWRAAAIQEAPMILMTSVDSLIQNVSYGNGGGAGTITSCVWGINGTTGNPLGSIIAPVQCTNAVTPGTYQDGLSINYGFALSANSLASPTFTSSSTGSTFTSSTTSLNVTHKTLAVSTLPNMFDVFKTSTGTENGKVGLSSLNSIPDWEIWLNAGSGDVQNYIFASTAALFEPPVATNGSNKASPSLLFQSNHWNGSASVGSFMSWIPTIATGTTPTSGLVASATQAVGGALAVFDSNKMFGIGNCPTVATACPVFWDSNGINHQNGTAPAASSGAITGTNSGGQVSGLVAATTLTLTFANSGWNTWASCTANTNVTATQPFLSAISNTAVTFTFPALTGTLYYHCDGN